MTMRDSQHVRHLSTTWAPFTRESGKALVTVVILVEQTPALDHYSISPKILVTARKRSSREYHMR